ncbi:MAG: N-6 DNA methylase [Candidatus Hodarchaeota archaeon]
MTTNAFNSQKAKGQYFTPESLVQSFISRILTYFFQDCKIGKIKVLDPATGEGIFLETLIPLIKPFIGNAVFYGIDIDSEALKKAEVRLYPLAQSYSYDITLKARNFFLEFPKKKNKDKFDLILGNPPHAARYTKSDWDLIQNTVQSTDYPRLRFESSVYFVLHSLNLIKIGGLLGFILPKPIIYSKRWTKFRKSLLLTNNLLEVLDLGNQFSGQLQEQIGIIIQKQKPNLHFKTGYWSRNNKTFRFSPPLPIKVVVELDNLLVGVNQNELAIIYRLYGDEYKFLDIIAFRGLNSKYRVSNSNIPLIEKRSIGNGFLLPPRHYVKSDLPDRIIQRQQKPKIIAHRIIGYRTQPSFLLNLNTWVDQKGEIITHETVINIIPRYPQIYSLSSIAGLIQSSFVEWWLRHAVYTKRFVTSKDFDNDYISRIRVPRHLGLVNHRYRKLLKKFLSNGNFNPILQNIENQSNLDKIYTIGKIYEEFQRTGEILKNKMINLLQKKSEIKSLKRIDKQNKEFHKIKWLIRQLHKNGNIFEDSNSLNQLEYKNVKEEYENLKQYRYYIDQVVYSLYKITPEERRIIEVDKDGL